MKKQSLLLQSLVLSLLFCLLPLQYEPLQFKSLQPMQALGANFSFSQPGQGWVKDERGWKYRFESGPWFTGGWHTINQRRYHFDRDGYMEHGWYTENGSWYYLGIPGDESTGLLRRGWITDDGKRYFLDADGIMKTGWLKMGEDWFYLKASGAAAAGETLELGRQRCTFREDGVLQGTRPLGNPDPQSPNPPYDQCAWKNRQRGQIEREQNQRERWSPAPSDSWLAWRRIVEK